MNIKVLQYIDNTQKNNITTGQAAVTGDNITSKISSAVNSTGTDFDQVLDDAKMAEAAVAIDRLIAQSNGGSVDMSLVQRFFDQNGINIELCRNTVSPSAAVNNTAAYSGSPAINRGSVKLEASGLSCSADLDAIFNEAASKYGVDAKFLKLSPSASLTSPQSAQAVQVPWVSCSSCHRLLPHLVSQTPTTHTRISWVAPGT
ncbi:hypothetical protein [Agathobacter rectalis]|uniref:hypothetical protein n=1 Tax=Agathobacter rectalis TaxID=39491 RepID=UPI0035A00905